jgi:hypothetical protein
VAGACGIDRIVPSLFIFWLVRAQPHHHRNFRSGGLTYSNKME